MKKKELMPTEENLINTLINDTIGRNKDIVDFLNILKCQEASCSIALNGKWGSGRHFSFVKQKCLLMLLVVYHKQIKRLKTK